MISEADLVRAGQIALVAARLAWHQRIVDPSPRLKNLDARSRAFIDNAIRSPDALGWTWQSPYLWDGDFEWCGAFAAGYAWGAAGLDGDQRELYASSTDRLNAWAQYRSMFGPKSVNERECRERFPKPGEGGRLFIELDESSTPKDLFSTGYEARAGDILLVGGVPGSYRGARAWGTHVVLVDRFDEARGGFVTVEGNASGRGPNGETYQGVVEQFRPIGLRDGESLKTYHVRRVLRPGRPDVRYVLAPPKPLS